MPRPDFALRFERSFGKLLFASRWIQTFMYFGLAILQVIYAIRFLGELAHLANDFQGIREEDFLLIVLGFVDMVMVANLILMVTVGGFGTFVAQVHTEESVDRPEWMDKINPHMLKVKLTSALIGISSVHLLKTFINAANVEYKTAIIQVSIHVAFLASTIVLWVMDRSYTDQPGSAP